MERKISSKPWTGRNAPGKILVMRFQALGDTIITLPYLQNLKRQFPAIELHFLTRDEVSPIPKNVSLFNKVITIGGGRNIKAQAFLALFKLPWLFFQRYDAVIDLQNHKLSRLIRRFLFVNAWSEFDMDRNSVLSAGERTKRTIEALWKWKIDLDTNFTVQNNDAVTELLKKNGWKTDHGLIVLNPAGFSPSRSWPLNNYVEFSKRWLEKINPKVQFVLLLLPSRDAQARLISEKLGNHCINLTGLADQMTAFTVVRKSSLVVSEDSGLMHMAWVQGIPTLALFSSSKKEWSAPLGERSYCLDSSDMECGPCMQEICKYGDNRCLTRHTPEIVLNYAVRLYEGK